MKKLMLILVILLLAGCRDNNARTENIMPAVPQSAEDTPLQEQGVANEGAEEYTVHTVQNEDGTFTCMDGSIKDTAQECLDLAIDIITQQRIQESDAQIYKTTVKQNDDGTFTCGDGTVVDDSDECVKSAMQNIGG